MEKEIIEMDYVEVEIGIGVECDGGCTDGWQGCTTTN